MFEKVRASLDCTRKLEDQDPLTWSKFLQWVRFFAAYTVFCILITTCKAHRAMPSLAARYENFWPVELSVKAKLGKIIAHDRHHFKVAMEKHKQKRALSATTPRIETSISTVCRCNLSLRVVFTHHYLH